MYKGSLVYIRDFIDTGLYTFDCVYRVRILIYRYEVTRQAVHLHLRENSESTDTVHITRQ